ncbi:MAG: hypothetical protein JXA93_25495 [Anaerolineae bacterium]|nr:hypothetical protein [Anaerolineae bacterium]
MDYSDEYELFVQRQILQCENDYAHLEHLRYSITGEMTHLHDRLTHLSAVLDQLHDARILYRCPYDLSEHHNHHDYNLVPSKAQSAEVTDQVQRKTMVRREESALEQREFEFDH